MNGIKQRPRWHGLPLFLSVFIAVFLCASIVIVKVAWKIQNNVDGNNGDAAAAAAGKGVADMLNNFVDTQSMKNDHRKVSSIQKRKKIIDNKQQLQQSSSSASSQSQSSMVAKLIDRSHRIEIPDQNRTLAFVHIGKSGGSTISLLLRNGCMSAVDGVPCDPPDRWKKIPGQIHETIASKRIEFYLHTPHAESGKMAEYYRRVSSVVVVARDPLERFASAFLCRHPSNIDATRVRNVKIRREAERKGVEAPIWAKIIWGSGDPEKDQFYRAAFTGCYPNLEELAQCADPSSTDPAILNKVYETSIKWMLRGEHSKDISLNCREICQGIALGETDHIHHVRFNYESFLKDLPRETEVFVIRTPNLWQDWINVNKMLNGHADVPDKGSQAEAVNARGQLPVRNNLSSSGRAIICDILKNDIRIYVDLLNRAVNLSDEDVRAALEVAHKSCPYVMNSLVEDGSKTG